MRLCSLFAGIGGIERGFENTGYFTTVWANELDKKACQTYQENFNTRLFNCNLKELDINLLDDIDILTAGFPCQAFSVAGYQKGFNDDRGSLFFEILRVLKIKKPKVILLENVKNILTHDNGKTFNIIKTELNSLGYFVKYKVLNSCKYGNVPQNRERIYIVGFTDKEAFYKFQFPDEVKLTYTINDLLENEVDEKYYYTNSKYYPALIKQITKCDTIYQWRRTYARENKSKLCPTLTANMGTGGHNVPLIKDKKGIRKLTPRECARFQGFRDDFILPGYLPDTALYKQIGNSVTVGVIERIAEKLI